MGSALGTLATSFYLVLWFEVNQILITMGLILFLSGMVAIYSNKTFHANKAALDISK
jgi:hypothetical protein